MVDQKVAQIINLCYDYLTIELRLNRQQLNFPRIFIIMNERLLLLQFEMGSEILSDTVIIYR